ncbi:response regulator transcription factor [Brevundimonas sp.]|jgi:CheY-like chemotaxis protein|uniref:response regulator transcription factor n=1 Tax=Brevundimonas sp. TaxID=1871086 RepID=UPI00391DA282|nr:response regulator [Brevundimonas sp.]MCA3717377.1 response regulator [Brevundimonas sp.]
MVTRPGGEGRINLRQVKVLCVDSNSQGLEILGQMLMGFGVDKISRCQSGREAREALKVNEYDLVLLDAQLADDSGFDIVRWLRESGAEPARFMPVIIVTGHTREGQVITARDCGANFVVAKPTSPTVLMQRILWSAKGGRVFVEAPKFIGPDRRFKFDGVPATGGRRSTDLSGDLGEPQKANMSQDEIDNVFRPQKVSL